MGQESLFQREAVSFEARGRELVLSGDVGQFCDCCRRYVVRECFTDGDGTVGSDVDGEARPSACCRCHEKAPGVPGDLCWVCEESAPLLDAYFGRWREDFR
jgi:hypothetical protein